MHNNRMERRQRNHQHVARYLFTGTPGAPQVEPSNSAAATSVAVQTQPVAQTTPLASSAPAVTPTTTPARVVPTTSSSPVPVVQTTPTTSSSLVAAVLPTTTSSRLVSSPVVVPTPSTTSSAAVLPTTSSLGPATARLVTSSRASPSPVLVTETSPSLSPSSSASPASTGPQTSTILAEASPVSNPSSASSSATVKAVSAAAESSSTMSTGSIAGLASALAVFLIILGAFFVIRRKSRKTRRKNAQDAIGKYLPSGPDYGDDRYSPRELGDDDMPGGVGGPQMIERQPSWRGPRPPTMIESGRAGIGRTMVTGDSPISPVPPMPSFYPNNVPNSPGHSVYAQNPSAPYEEYNANGLPGNSGYASPQHQQAYPAPPIGRSLVTPYPFNQQPHQPCLPAAPSPAHFPNNNNEDQPQAHLQAEHPVSPQPSPFALPPLHSGSGADFDPRFSSIPSTFGHQQQASFPSPPQASEPTFTAMTHPQPEEFAQHAVPMNKEGGNGGQQETAALPVYQQVQQPMVQQQQYQQHPTQQANRVSQFNPDDAYGGF